MQTIRAILVATDFSPPAETAWQYAQALASAFKARLHLLHVVAPPPIAADLSGAETLALHIEAIAQQAMADARVRVDRTLATRRPRTLKAEGQVFTGPPVESILRCAEDMGADLVVMGTNGRGLVGHLMLGSVAERVVRRCPVPVLTVHAPAAAEAPRRLARRPTA